MASDSYADRLKEKINDMTECAICTDTLKEARLLPCFHSFCLKCLKDYGKDKTAANDINCPICRKSFKIPGKGFEELPINHFINKLIDITKLPDVGDEKESQDIFCDWCLTTKSQVAASGYCVDCSENLCELCLQRHKSVKTCKFHKTFPLDQKPGVNELLKMTVNNCEDHPHQQIDFYCDDCKTTACVVCYVAEHKDHKCSDIKKSSAEVTEKIDNGCEKVSSFVSETEEIVKLIETTEEDMDKNIEEVRESVKLRYEELKTLLDSHYKQLDDKLNDLKSVQKKKLQTMKEESEQEILMIKTLEKYWTEVKDRGSACDIVQAASSIEERLEELIKHHDVQHQERNKKSCLEKFEFKPASSICMNSLSTDHGDSMLGIIVKVESINNGTHRSCEEFTFQHTVHNISKLEESNLSKPYIFRNLSWRILAMPRQGMSTAGKQSNFVKMLGFFLQCDRETGLQPWSCGASAELRVLSYKPDGKPLCRKIQHVFFSKENDWGFSNYISLTELTDIKKGYCKDDTVVLEVHVKPDAPHGVGLKDDTDKQ